MHSLTPADLRALGHGSLRDLLNDLLVPGQRPEYSTVARWARAAGVLSGPDDPKREWDVSRPPVLVRARDAPGRDDAPSFHEAAFQEAASPPKTSTSFAHSRRLTEAHRARDESPGDAGQMGPTLPLRGWPPGVGIRGWRGCRPGRKLRRASVPPRGRHREPTSSRARPRIGRQGGTSFILRSARHRPTGHRGPGREPSSRHPSRRWVA